jgi:hypothetical protein
MNNAVSSVLYLMKSDGCEIRVSLPSLSRFPADYVTQMDILKQGLAE